MATPTEAAKYTYSEAYYKAQARYRTANRELTRERQKAHYAKNRDKIRARQKAYYLRKKATKAAAINI